MDIYSFQTNHLLEYELDYELKIRLLTSQRTVADKIKIFSRLRKGELAEPGKIINLNVCTISFEEERDGIQRSILSIQNVIDEFDGNASDSAINRVQSRLAHVTGRAQRIPIPENEVEAKLVRSYIQEVTSTCLLMEAELFEKIPADQNVEPLINKPPVIHVAAPVVHCATRNLPISEWQVNFNGEPKKLYSFLERITELAQARDVSHNELFKSAAEFFTGDAFVWYRSIKSNVKDWDALVVKLKNDFLHDDIDDDLWEQIKRRKQKKGESTVVFIAHLEALFCRLSRPPAEATKVKHIKQNLFSDFISRLALSDITTVEQLSNLCRKLEEADYLKDKGKPRDQVASFSESSNSKTFKNFSNYNNKQNKFRKSFGNNSKNISNQSTSKNVSGVSNDRPKSNNDVKANKTKSNVVCWNCKLPNHTYLDCRANRGIFCYKCGESNVRTSTCPKCSKNE